MKLKIVENKDNSITIGLDSETELETELLRKISLMPIYVHSFGTELEGTGRLLISCDDKILKSFDNYDMRLSDLEEKVNNIENRIIKGVNMKHARPDYNRIQDPANLIPENEPVFLIRAQDITSPKVVRYWAAQAEREGAKKDIIRSAQKWASRMEKWQRDHMKKIPDMPKKSLAKEVVDGL